MEIKINMLLIFAAVSIFTEDVSADTLFTKTENGTISLNRGLSAHECEVAYKKALGLPVTPEEIKAHQVYTDERNKRAAEWNKTHPCNLTSQSCQLYVESDGGHFVSGHDVIQAECLK